MDSKENIILGSDIPKIILDNENNLSEHFIRLLSELGNRTALVSTDNNFVQLLSKYRVYINNASFLLFRHNI